MNNKSTYCMSHIGACARALKYCLFPGLLFSSLWISLAIMQQLAVWEIVVGFVLLEAVAWLGGKD